MADGEEDARFQWCDQFQVAALASLDHTSRQALRIDPAQLNTCAWLTRRFRKVAGFVARRRIVAPQGTGADQQHMHALLGQFHELNHTTRHLAELMMNRSVREALAGRNVKDM